MWRQVHLWTGLILSLLIMVISLTGTILATKPVYDHYLNDAGIGDLTVADAIYTISSKNKRIVPQQITVYPTGKVKLVYTKRNKRKKSDVSLSTGELIKKKKNSKEPVIYNFSKTLHRSFFLGDNGRILPAIGAFAMFALSLSGFILLLRRVGGFAGLIKSMSWKGFANQHSALGRLTIIPLLIMIVTALWLSAVTFDFVSAGEDKPPQYPESVEELDPVKPWDLKGLKNIPMSNVEQVLFPIPEDWFDVWTVKTDSEYIFIDQFTGEVLSRESLSLMAQTMRWVTILHTGEGTVWWSLVLLISSLGIPFFSISGYVIWWKKRKLKGGKIRNQASKSQATVLILVGSENGSTWGFAKELHQELIKVYKNSDGSVCKVRTTDMNAIAGNFPAVEKIFIFAATYGDGDAPQSAKNFIPKLSQFSKENADYCVLAFGDRAFPKFCAYAHEAQGEMHKRFGDSLLPITEIDKQSSQAFATWSRQLGGVLNVDLQADYTPVRPKTKSITLFEKQDFGHDVAPMSILRFNRRKIPQHQAGDWLAVYHPETSVPRLYSIGSESKYDKCVEICVREQEGGLCSPWLCGLAINDSIDITIIKNPRFHVPKTGSVIMIGAGTGFAPFVGMIKHNLEKRDITLFWGGRSPNIDGIYQDEIKDWLNKKLLTNFFPAWSRDFDKTYVQHEIAKRHEFIIEQLKKGACIMICGGRNMETEVAKEIDICAQAIGMSLTELKEKNRYLEDVY